MKASDIEADVVRWGMGSSSTMQLINFQHMPHIGRSILPFGHRQHIGLSIARVWRECSNAAMHHRLSVQHLLTLMRTRSVFPVRACMRMSVQCEFQTARWVSELTPGLGHCAPCTASDWALEISVECVRLL